MLVINFPCFVLNNFESEGESLAVGEGKAVQEIFHKATSTVGK